MKIGNWKAHGIILVLSLTGVFFLYQILSQGGHNFSNLPDWYNLKQMGRTGLMGLREFSTQRQSLAGNQLNLGEWHGHNQMIWDQRGPWDEVRFEFELGEDAYLWVFFEQTDQGHQGFRISRNSKFHSGLFSFNDRGGIVQRNQTPLEVQNGWNHFRIFFEKSRTRFLLNDKEIATGPSFSNERSPLSFRSGLNSVSIDQVQTRKGPLSAQEDFSPRFRGGLLGLALGIYLVLFLILLGIMILTLQSRQRILGLITYQFILLVLLFGYGWIDINYRASKYFVSKVLPFNRVFSSQVLSDMEANRVNLFHQLWVLAGHPPAPEFKQPPPDLMALFKMPQGSEYKSWPSFQFTDKNGASTLYPEVKDMKTLPDSKLKIMALGTSQTWGAGSQGVRETFVAQMIRSLDSRLGLEVAGLNLSVCGTTIPELWENYEQVLKLWKPDLLMINLSNNDNVNLPVFKEYLQKIATLNQQLKIKTVFVLEANDIEVGDKIETAHQVMKEVARQNGIPVLDLYGYLRSSEVYDSGLIWFDLVHFDQYGHDLTARWLTDQLIPILKRR